MCLGLVVGSLALRVWIGAMGARVHVKIPNVRDSDFIREIRSIFVEQFEMYRESCSYSDVFRPLSGECRNVTGFGEMELAALTVAHLLRYPTPHVRVTDLRKLTGVEVGHVADHVVAPLISAYYVSGESEYLVRAVALGKQLLENGLARTFIGHKDSPFGRVFIESVSSVYPVFAALYHLTGDSEFGGGVRVFIDSVRSAEDIPFSVYADLARIGRLVPKFQIEVNDLLTRALARISDENPIVLHQQSQVHVYSIDPCSIAPYIPSDHPKFSKISTKCERLIKRRPFPKRMSGSSEFGKYELVSSFAFEGELLELFWRNNKTDTLCSQIREVLTSTHFGRAVTGIVNVTESPFRSDNIMHHTLYSRWLTNSILIDSGFPFSSVVLSRNGHILALD